MNIYELFGLLLVAGLVVMLVAAAHGLGEGERIARRAEQAEAERQERQRQKSGA